jgi:ribose/xylose/arabinose/galactoside ABC-type transport system permease subunit
MTDRSPLLPDARIIPLRVVARVTAIGPADAGILFRTGTRTLRPIEVLLLAPILVPVTVIVLLLLLAWFVLWLATVGTLVAANLIGDMSRAALYSGGLLRRLDRRAIGYQGH